MNRAFTGVCVCVCVFHERLCVWSLSFELVSSMLSPLCRVKVFAEAVSILLKRHHPQLSSHLVSDTTALTTHSDQHPTCPPSLTPSLPPSLPHSLTHSLTHSLPPSLPLSLPPSLPPPLPLCSYAGWSRYTPTDVCHLMVHVSLHWTPLLGRCPPHH